MRGHATSNQGVDYISPSVFHPVQLSKVDISILAREKGIGFFSSALSGYFVKACVKSTEVVRVRKMKHGVTKLQ